MTVAVALAALGGCGLIFRIEYIVNHRVLVILFKVHLLFQRSKTVRKKKEKRSKTLNY